MKKILFVLLFCFASQAQDSVEEGSAFVVNCDLLLNLRNSAKREYVAAYKSIRTLNSIDAAEASHRAYVRLQVLSGEYNRFCQDHQEPDTQ